MIVPDVRLKASRGRPAAGKFNPVASTLATGVTGAVTTSFPAGLTTQDAWTNLHFRANGRTVNNGTSCYFTTGAFLSYPTVVLQGTATATAAGQKLALHGQFLTGFPTPEYQVFINDQPLYATTQTQATGVWYHTKTFASAGVYDVKIVYSGNMTFLNWWTSANLTMSAPTVTPYKIAWFGDSWAEKYSGGSNALDKTALKTIPWHIMMASGAYVYEAGQASTGYAANASGAGGRTIYNSARVTDYMLSFAPDLVIIEGSVNDSASAATLGTAATALFAQFATTLPNTALVVMGIQPVYAQMNATAVGRNTAIINAALAAPNVVGVIDWYGERAAGSTDWLTGTGFRGSPVGDGNQDTYVTSDNLHLTEAGRAALAPEIIDRIRFMRSSMAA